MFIKIVTLKEIKYALQSQTFQNLVLVVELKAPGVEQIPFKWIQVGGIAPRMKNDKNLLLFQLIIF